MQIGYFFKAVATSNGEMPHTVVKVMPLANLPGAGIEPSISITIPIASTAASVEQTASDALQLARRLVPESAFAQWALDYSIQMQAQPSLPPLTLPADASEQLMAARFPAP